MRPAGQEIRLRPVQAGLRQGARPIVAELLGQCDDPLLLDLVPFGRHAPARHPSQGNVAADHDARHLAVLPDTMCAIHPHHALDVGGRIIADAGGDQAARGKHPDIGRVQLGLVRQRRLDQRQ